MSNILDKLNYLNETKNMIKNSLISKGVDIDDSTPFRDYADKISNIPEEISTATLTINSNLRGTDPSKSGIVVLTKEYGEIRYNLIQAPLIIGRSYTIAIPSIITIFDGDNSAYYTINVNGNSELISDSYMGDTSSLRTFVKTYFVTGDITIDG